MNYTRLARCIFLILSLVQLCQQANAQSGTDFSLLVHNIYTNFRGKYSPVQGDPNSILIREPSRPNDVLIYTNHNGLNLDKVKIFLPPGTKALSVSASTFYSSEEAKAAAKFKTIPQSRISDITSVNTISDTESSLARLINGDELRFYSPPFANAINISQAPAVDRTLLSTGGYLYFNLMQIPGGSLLNFSTLTIVDAACYTKWYDTPVWDSSGNPSESASHTCSDNQTLSIQPATLTFGTSQVSAKITPIPNTPALPTVSGTCSATYVPNIVGGVTPPVILSPPTVATENLWQVSLNPLASISIVSTITATITCNTANPNAPTATGTLTINPKSTPIPATGFQISPNTTLTVGGTVASLLVTPTSTSAGTPEFASDSSCSLASTSSIPNVSLLAISNVSKTGATIRLTTDSTALGALAASNGSATQTVQCGDFTPKVITINPASNVLTGFELSPQAGYVSIGSAQSYKLVPLPIDASLGNCSVTSSNAYIKIAPDYSISFDSTASKNLYTEVDQKIQCTSGQAVVNGVIKIRPSLATVNTAPIASAGAKTSGATRIVFTLTRPDDEIATSADAKSTVFVGLLIEPPGHPSIYGQKYLLPIVNASEIEEKDLLARLQSMLTYIYVAHSDGTMLPLVFDGTDSRGGLKYDVRVADDIDGDSFKRDAAMSKAEPYAFEVPFSLDLLKSLNARLVFAYYLNGNKSNFRYLNTIWSAVTQ